MRPLLWEKGGVVKSNKNDSLYPFQQFPGLLGEVRWEVEFALQDLVDGLLAVLSGERRLRGETGKVNNEQNVPNI